MGLSALVLERVMSLIPLVLSLTVHEWAHALVATHLGDTTAKEQGRLTLNPIAHIDVVGTLALPLLGIPFGWAKPVPVEPARFRSSVSMTRGMLLTAAAGPLSNLVLVLICSGALAIGHRTQALPAEGSVGQVLLERGVLINLVLAAFNLLPVPPLDGSRVVDAFVPFEHRAAWKKVGLVLGALLVILFLLPILSAGVSIAGWMTHAFTR